MPVYFTRMSTVGAARRKTTSSLPRRPSGRPHLVHKGHGQSASAVPARRRLLDHVGLARIDAQAFDVARRAIRHFAPAAHQARRPHRRDEDDDQDYLPTSGPARIFCDSCSGISASSPERRAQRFECQASPVNPQTFHPHSGSCRRGCGASASKQNWAQSRLRAGVRGVTVKRCIMAARGNQRL